MNILPKSLCIPFQSELNKIQTVAIVFMFLACLFLTIY